jgi:hypothetical protein
MRHARRYTSFAEPAATDDQDGREAGRYSQFQRGGRDMALAKWMKGNDAALKDAEVKMDALIAKYCVWLTTECCELPPVFRFDAFLRIRPAPLSHECDVFSGELTELGACTLGWDLPDMASNLFTAVIGNCLGDCACTHPGCACKVPDQGQRVDISSFVEDLKRRQERWEVRAAQDEERWAKDRDGGGDDYEEEEEEEEEGGDDDDKKYGGGGGGDDESSGAEGSVGAAEDSGVASSKGESDAEKKKRRNKAKSEKQKRNKQAAAAGGKPKAAP